MAPCASGGFLPDQPAPSPVRPSKAWGVLAVGLLAAVGAFGVARHFSRARTEARFEMGVEESLRRLEDRLRHCEDLIRGVRGLASATPLDRTRYRAHLEALDLETRFPGLLGVTYGIPVPPERRAEVQAWLGREHPEQPARIHPAWGEGPAAIVILGEPARFNHRALGFNTFAFPEQRASLEQAVDSGEWVASPPMAVAQAPEAGPGLVLRLAVYRSGAATDSPEARRRAWVGYANAVFLLRELAAGAADHAQAVSLGMTLSDHTDPARPVAFFQGGAQAVRPAPFASERRLRVGGRTWVVTFASGQGFLQAGEVGLPWMVGAGVLLIAGLLALLVHSIGRTGDRAQALAERMTERLRHSESRLRAITTVMPDAIFVLDQDGRYLEIHTGDPSRLVAPEDRLLGRTVRETLPPEVADRVVATLRKALADGRVEACEYALETQRGRLHFEARVAPMGPGAEGPPSVIWVARDVTERRIQEEAHRQAQRLESLGLLAGGIAHDFNNLLAAIQGYLSLQRMDLAAGQDPSRHLDRMEGSIQRAADLARQLLAYSGRGTLKVEPLDLNGLVSDMAELLGVSRPKKAALEVLLAPGLPPVLGDRAQLQQVVMNLVTNAGDAIGDRPGTIRVQTGACEASAEWLAERMPGQAVSPGSFVTLRVEDDGCGMPPEVLARIFEPFFTTKPTGRGLGLAAIRGILGAHRAGVSIRSIVGQGTAFEVLFPAQAEGGPVAPQGGSGVSGSLRLEGTLLVADDEPALRETSRAMLEGFGLEVVEASDGEEALERFRAHRSDLRGAMLDLTMPRLGGLEVYRQIRAVAPDFPILLVSGYSREEVPAPVASGEPTVFLQKPFGLGDLRRSLELLFREA